MGRLLHCFAFVGVLFLPMLQSLTRLCPTRPLGGVEQERPAEPAPSLAAWHAGIVQESLQTGFEHRLGLRDWMVRTDNQVRFWLTGEVKGGVTSGRDGWLYSTGYLPCADQADAATQRSLLLSLANLRRLQDVLDRHGVLLMLVLSPNKARLYPEHLPLFHQQAAAAAVPSNYEFAAEYLHGSGLRCFDAHRQFARWKEEGVGFPLFTRGGAHWSAFASAKITSLLLDDIDRHGVDVRNLDVVPGAISDGPQGSEDDLVGMANLLDERPWRESTTVPRVTVRAGDRSGPIRLMIEGTSFVWNMLLQLNQHLIGSPMSFRYYLGARYEYEDGRLLGKRRTEWDPANLAAVREEVLGYQVILIEINELMLPSVGHGMIEGLLLLFGEPVLQELTPELEAYRQRNARRR